MHWQRLWWCLPIAVLAAVDGLLTLWGQPAAYWAGDFSDINEGHPVAAWFLSVHPLAFTAAGVPYLLLVAALVVWLPRRWALLVVAVAAAGHAVGAFLWCRILFRQPAFALTPLAFLTMALAVLAWRRGRIEAGVIGHLPADFSDLADAPE